MKHEDEVNQVHKGQGGGNYKCDICHKILHTEELLKIHLSYTHNEKEGSICDYCGKIFQNKTNLQSHVTHVHEGQN